MKMSKSSIIALTGLIFLSFVPSDQDEAIIRKIYDEQLTNSPAYDNLKFLTKNIGCRLSGSEALDKAVEYTRNLMLEYDFDTVYLQPVMVSNWNRGRKEVARIVDQSSNTLRELHCLALGYSIGTGDNGVLGEVVEFKSMEALREADDDLIKGRIVFLNQPMDPTLINKFESYHSAVEQREEGAPVAFKKGAIALVIRSVSINNDDSPHTGYMANEGGDIMIPAIAISTNDANYLNDLLKKNNSIKLYIETHCKTLEKVRSYNVIGELKGDKYPEEIIVAGGHIDSWDVGEGAHDDGGACIQSIEIIRTMKVLGIKPLHTIRIVLWADEENSWAGNIAYANKVSEINEKHLVAMESDHGAFTPLGFHYQCANNKYIEILMSLKNMLEPYQLTIFSEGRPGADIEQLKDTTILKLGLFPDSQRYFTLHHSEKDVFEAVDKRELELGAAAMTSMIYLLDRHLDFH